MHNVKVLVKGKDRCTLLVHPADAERLFAGRMGATTIEIASSHVVMTSHPDEVAEFIEQAASA